MHRKFRARTCWPLIALGALGLFAPVPRGWTGRSAAAAPQTPPARVTLDDAIDLALKHNHSLQAARTTILQNQAQEITANLRPNPTLLGDTQFLPFFQPNDFSGTYLDNSAQFDVGVSYLFERGKKRQHRLQAAKDQTAVTSAPGGRQRAHADVQRRIAIHFGACSLSPIWTWRRRTWRVSNKPWTSARRRTTPGR